MYGQRQSPWPSTSGSSNQLSTTATSVSTTCVHSFSDLRFLLRCHFVHCVDSDLVICSGFSNFMQQLPVSKQPPFRFRPTLAYRPLISLTPTSSYILAGGGQAIFIQHSILTCLFDSTGANPDIRALGQCAPALQLIAQSWTQVDTPSVSSRTARPNFWD